MKNSSASFFNAEHHNLLTEMRTGLFLFLNPTPRTVCSLSFLTQQSFGVILRSGLTFGREAQPGFWCLIPAEKEGEGCSGSLDPFSRMVPFTQPAPAFFRQYIV